MVSHLVSRGVEAYHQVQKLNNVEFEIQVPGWGGALLAITTILFFLTMSAIEYTFARLIPTLLMVESPQALLFEPLALDDTDATLKSTEPELLLVKQQPITSSFRTTIKHLHAKGGFRARFRGVGIFAVYNVAMAWVAQFFSVLPFVPRGTGPVFAMIIFANMSMAWTHIVISEASPKPWYKRIPSARLFKKIVGPTTILAIAEQLAIVVPATLALVYGADAYSDPTKLRNKFGAEKHILFMQALSVVVVGLVMSLCVVLPANVMLTRVQASLLDDNEETIVPFDRSFGGKVVPEIVGGSGVLGALDAWKTFDWNSRIRLVKAYVKVFFMQLALSLLFFGVLVAEILMIVGRSDLEKLLPSEGNGDEKSGL